MADGASARPWDRLHRLPVVAGLDVDGQRDVERDRGLHRLAHDRDQSVDPVARHLEQQLVVDLEQHPRGRPGLAIRSATRIIAIFMMSAAVPWIGMLIAIRSPAPRSAGIRDWSSGIDRLRPRSVVTKPCVLATP